MTFISYAQNFEDVMLWRALGSVEAGFWIDVGAAHPTELSVTRAFYDRGWCGVNIEPEPHYAAALRAERPRDINLQVAIAAEAGRATLHRIAGTGLSTFDASVAEGHAAAGYPAAEPMEVEVTTLAAVCAAHAPHDIHFLKIDAEGAEREVLIGADLRAHRPWIIVAEATFPFSPVPRIDVFADVLIDADYRQCWFDGLNAFFVAVEHEARLAQFFQAPPNFFDTFVRADQVAAVTRAEVAERRVAELDSAWHEARAALSAATASHQAAAIEFKTEIDRREAEIHRLEAEIARREAEIHQLEAEIDRLEAKIHRLEPEIDRREAEIHRLEAEIDRREAEIHHLGAEVQQREAEIHRLGAEVQQREAETQRLRVEAQGLGVELEAIRRSTSWRLTSPLRWAGSILRRP